MDDFLNEYTNVPLTTIIHPRLEQSVLQLLNERGITNVTQFLDETPEKLSSITKLEFKVILVIRKHIIAQFCEKPLSGLEAYKNLYKCSWIISSGIESVDNLLGGGLHSHQLFEIYGLSESGKTQFCLKVTSYFLKNNKQVSYIDAGGDFSLSTIQSLLANDDNIDKLTVYEIVGTEELLQILVKILKALKTRRKIHLIVIDSIIWFLKSPKFDRVSENLNIFANLLREIASKHGVCVICVNSATSYQSSDVNLELNDLKPCLGKYWRHVPHVTLFFETVSSVVKRIRLDKSTRFATGGECTFKIRDDGAI